MRTSKKGCTPRELERVELLADAMASEGSGEMEVFLAVFFHLCVAAVLIAEADEFGFKRSRRNIGLCIAWLPLVVVVVAACVVVAIPYVLWTGGQLHEEPFDSHQDGSLSSEPAKA